jgi:hypothetical protein
MTKPEACRRSAPVLGYSNELTPEVMVWVLQPRCVQIQTLSEPRNALAL